jgi:ABC-type Fe3+-hydroxamate transport system substrate-binding protein
VPETPQIDLATPPRDASGVPVRVPTTPRRIVSLVPSVTESLFALGLGERVVGVTDWCIHPATEVATRVKVGGTKNPDRAAIERLTPDLVLANLEENREIDVRRLRDAGLTVWVDYPRTVADAITQIGWLADLGAAEGAREHVLEPVERAFAAARAAQPSRRASAFIAVWKDPWMTIARDTYAYDLLALCGIEPLFADRSDSRYPRVALEEVAAHAPELVLLPDEPYRFGESDARELAEGALRDTPAARGERIHVIDGTLPFWHGPRIAPAIALLRRLASGCGV